MKKIGAFLALASFVLLFTVITKADFPDSTDSCSGLASIFPGSATINCSAGVCYGEVNPSSVSVSGSCTGGESFSAVGTWSGGPLQGSCFNGEFSAEVPYGSVNWSGQCSGGEFSASPSPVSGGSVFGSCEANGVSSVQLPLMNLELSGECSSFGSN